MMLCHLFDDALPFVYDDGGRAAAGYNDAAGDCVCRSISIATGMAYSQVYASLNGAEKTERPIRGKRSSTRNGV
jgi:hypothetical protein